MTSERKNPLGRVITAMVTPFDADGGVDLDGVQELAAHLVDKGGNDGLVVNGTTGEAPTLTDAEKMDVLRAVVAAVGDRATVISGAGSYDTLHSVGLAKQAEKAGAHGLLVVTPYYNKPPQEGVAAHFLAIADATDLPVMTYDIPGRTGTPIELDTFKRIAEHPRIVANKDAKADLGTAAWAIRETGLAWYSGDDILTLPFMSVGAVGVVSVCGHLVGNRIKDMFDAFEGGDAAKSLAIHQELLPVFTGIFRAQGVILTKAALNDLGLPAGPVRLPLVNATDDQKAQLRRDLADGLVAGFSA